MFFNSKRKKIGIFFLFFFVPLGVFLFRYLSVAAGFKVKMLCSLHFVSQRAVDVVMKDDLSFFPMQIIPVRVDEKNQVVQSQWLGLTLAKAKHREGFGCALVRHDFTSHPKPWPVQKHKGQHFKQVHDDILESKVKDFAFDPDMKTRSLLVLHNNNLVLEKYAPGFDESTKQLGWSMSKSVWGMLVALMVEQNRLVLGDRQLFSKWEKDDRRNITLGELLYMESGLAFSEIYSRLSDATQMLYFDQDVSERAKSKKRSLKKFAYSSGSSNLMSNYIRKKIDNDEQYWRLPHDVLFSKLGMHDVVMEMDEMGNFIASTFMYASARSWLRLGQVLLDQSFFNSNHFKLFTQPSLGSNEGYGGHVWLNQSLVYPSAPRDMLYFSGYQEQRLFVIPSRQLVVLRLGGDRKKFDFDRLLKTILEHLS